MSQTASDLLDIRAYGPNALPNELRARLLREHAMRLIAAGVRSQLGGC